MYPLADRTVYPKKNSAFKCYLSKSTMYEEDPHWYDILGAHGDEISDSPLPSIGLGRAKEILVSAALRHGVFGRGFFLVGGCFQVGSRRGPGRRYHTFHWYGRRRDRWFGPVRNRFQCDLGVPSWTAMFAGGVRNWGVGWFSMGDAGKRVDQMCRFLQGDGNGVGCWWRCSHRNIHQRAAHGKFFYSSQVFLIYLPGIPGYFIKIIDLLLRMLKNFLSPPPKLKYVGLVLRSLATTATHLPS